MLNKDKIKGFVIGIVAASVAISATAFAQNIQKTLNAVYRDIKLVVNGNTTTPKDANGNVVEPFIVDGTTYLPVRAVAEALGQEVSWDGETSTVYIGEQPSEKVPAFEIDVESLNSYKDTVLATVNNNKVSGAMVNFFINQPSVYSAINSVWQYKPGDTLQTIKIGEETAAKYFSDSAMNNIAATYNAAELAVKKGLDKTEEGKTAVEEASNSFFSQFPTDESYNEFLTYYATTDAAMKEIVNKNALANLYFQNYQNELINASDDALYKDFTKNFVHVKHILVESKEEADKIIADLSKGADFSELAKLHSIDPGQGEDGYVFTKGEMVKEFEDAAFSMKDGTFTKEAVKSQYGYHIIYKYTLTKDTFTKNKDAIKQSYAYTNYYNHVAEVEKLNPVKHTSDYTNYISNIK